LLASGDYVLPATGNFPFPPEIPPLGPTTGAPLSTALAWSSEISAVERDRTSEIESYSAAAEVLLARHTATVDALEVRRRAAWSSYFDVLGYGFLGENGTPVERSAYISAGGRVSVVPRDSGPGPSSGKGKGKRVAESEDEDDDIELLSGSGSGGMDLE
jgi:hypothetical protein